MRGVVSRQCLGIHDDVVRAWPRLVEGSIAGDRKTLVADAFIPAIMAVIYLGLMLYFRGIGGYKPLHIEEQGKA